MNRRGPFEWGFGLTMGVLVALVCWGFIGGLVFALVFEL